MYTTQMLLDILRLVLSSRYGSRPIIKASGIIFFASPAFIVEGSQTTSGKERKDFSRAMAVIKILAFLLVLHISVADEDVTCPEIVTRSQWGGAPPSDVNYLIVPIPYVVIQHTVTMECNTPSQCASRVENIYSYHANNLGWGDIGYSFLIGGDGKVYEGRGWSREGAHTYGYNKKSVGIAFIGNFQDKNASQNMLNAAHKLILCGKSMGVLRSNVRVIGARQVGSTASPGYQLFTQIQNWPEWVTTP